ncbi:MAG: branched-chain amino acid ABC transporter permease [Thermodesulfobacteriota bacterium]|jgi:branched-chain amino acid transport system permease protein
MSEKEKISHEWKKPKKYIPYAILLIFLLLLPLFRVGPYFIHICILILTYIIATSSLRTVFISGQVSVGHAAFMGIGAYTSAVVSLRMGWTPWITMLVVGPLTAMLVALLSGYLFCRLRTIYFSMITLFFGIAVEAVMRMWVSLTGGRSGLIGFPRLTTLNIPGLMEIDFATSKTPYYYLFLFLTFIATLILYRLEKSRTGMNWMAIAQSPLVASSVGVSETKFRVLAFGVGCFFAGLSGSIYAHYSGVISSSSFSLLPSIYLVTYVLLGGVNNFAGPIIGVIVLVAIPELFRTLKEFAPFVFGGIMLLVIFLMPQGLAGLFQSVKSLLSKTV